MFENKQMTRFPTIRFWIKDINEGIFNEEENTFQTIFGRVKRIMLFGTIIQKREITQTNQANSFNIDGISTLFILDDGTGLINAVKWNMGPEEFKNFSEGDLVQIIGLLRSRFNSPNLTIEIIKRVDNPNDVLLHDASIIRKIKSGNIENLPLNKAEDEFDETKLEIETELNNNDVSLKNTILEIIQKNSKAGKGTHLNDLKNNLDMNEKGIKSSIRDLEYEGKIFLSDEDTYLSWD